MIDVWGADHGGYVKRMQAAVSALSGGRATLDVKLCQLVKLMRDGEPVKMSKRAGDFVTLREVVDEVGVDAVRFMMLFRKNDATLEFDLAKVIEQSKDNPVFYVQYAHARGKSVLRQALAAFPGPRCQRRSPGRGAARTSHRRGRTGARQIDRRNIRGRSRRRPLRTSRIASLFTCTNSRASFIRTGIAVKISLNYALLMKKDEICPALGWRWFCR